MTTILHIGFALLTAVTSPTDATIVKNDKRWTGADDGTFKTWADAVLYCNDLSQDSERWRLPTIDELLSLFDDNRKPVSEGFILSTNRYWSATAFAGQMLTIPGPEGAWLMNLDDGSTGYIGKNAPAAKTLCVSGPQESASVFSRMSDEVVFDSLRKRWWVVPKDGIASRGEAETVCKKERTGRRSWRLPKPEELRSIIDRTRTEPAYYSTFDGIISESWYWTNRLCGAKQDCARVVGFKNGSETLVAPSATARTICVSDR